MDLDLSVEIADLKLKNPVMNASGTYDPVIHERLFNPNLLGAVVLKSLTLNPREGNPPPRIFEVPCGIVNSIGIQNEGVAEFIRTKIPLLKKYSETVIIASVSGLVPNEYVEVVKALDQVDIIKAYEINLSCPNLEKGGANCALDPQCIQEVTSAVRDKTKKPVIVKLAPDVTDIVAYSKVAVDAGADALTIANTYRALVLDLKSKKPIFYNIVAGLSGPAIKPITLRLVYEVVKALDIPVIAAGGIASATDALEYLVVGAKAVQVGSMNFSIPDIMIKIIQDIRSFMIENNIVSIKELIGSLKD